MITAPKANLHRASMFAALLGAATSSGPVMAQPLELDDFASWPTCVTGPANGPVTQGCESLDRDGDDDIDLRDFGGLQFIFGLTGLNADHCTDAEAMTGEGTFPFDNTGATLDGPAHTACSSFGESQIEHDVWACWTAPYDATVFVETCGLTGVDTKFAVYQGCECPVTDARLLTCNDDTCDVQSLVTFEATAGQSYLIRVGTFPGESGGVGSVSIGCGLDHCPGSGDCFGVHGSPGCQDQACCETTCTHDPFCCDTEWDEVCVEEALGLCGGGFTACDPGAGDCTVARPFVCVDGTNDGKLCEGDGACPDGTCRGQPGCDDVECCNAVCQADPFCCLDTWDELCTEHEAGMCFGTCGTGAGDCSMSNGTPGCENEACCAQVWPQDPFCCQVDWDRTCADTAYQLCP